MEKYPACSPISLVDTWLILLKSASCSAGSSTHKCQFWPVSTYFSFENWHVLETSGYCWSMAWNSLQNLKITVQPGITESFWQRFFQIIYYLRKMMIWKPWNLEMCEIPQFGMCFIPAELGMNTIVLVLKSCGAGFNKCKVIYAR